MKLNLSKPLVFLDLETTGTNPKEDKICEISMLKVMPPKGRGRELYESRVNPGIAIPEAASKVHGLTNEMLNDELTFVLIAKEVIDFIEGCDIAGFNSNSFDVPLLYNELTRAGQKWNWKNSAFVDVGNIYKIKESRTLSAAYMFYCEKKLENAHTAVADVEATEAVFLQQLEKYSEDPDFKDLKTISELAFYSNYSREIVDITGVFSKDEKGNIIFNFGKHKGEKATENYPYLYWMLRPENKFDPDVIAICKRLLFGKGTKNPVLQKQKENKLLKDLEG